ncbi:YihY/virulence factor BrkB family protein [Nocardioides mesophilus]|uniref:YihY/virulence factor BrkB family protein n=1 Tax=Nocardioides mesophilus TaxID=433659 RepID=A0A7G9RHR7_9ACTN|nr:YihY/virulence factor BrkB family protein [Nocardioides mesophilus]
MVDRFDELQRRRRALSIPLGVVYKFFDDQGGYLAAILTYYAFLAIFPILLIASSVLGFLIQGDAQLRQTILDSALGQFPIVGTQLGLPEGLRGSTSAVVVGALTALYGVVGLGQAALNAVNTTWAVPRNSRLNPVMSRLRSLGLMVAAGLTLLALAVLSTVASNVDAFSERVAAWLQVLAPLASVAITAVVLSLMLAVATQQRHRFRTVLPGGITIAVLWHVLQLFGGIYVSGVINRVSEMNGVFAVVLGLIALIYLGSASAVIGMEINVVLARDLYPRALLTPFTDAVELTDADRRVYTDYARAQRHKGFEQVEVTFRPRDEAAEDRLRGT